MEFFDCPRYFSICYSGCPHCQHRPCGVPSVRSSPIVQRRMSSVPVRMKRSSLRPQPLRAKYLVGSGDSLGARRLKWEQRAAPENGYPTGGVSINSGSCGFLVLESFATVFKQYQRVVVCQGNFYFTVAEALGAACNYLLKVLGG